MTLVVLAGSVLAAHAVADAFSAESKWRRLVPAAFVASALAVGVPWIDVVKSDFYDFDWSQPLGAAAAEHRVHVLHGRYPYLERFGVRTLRDVCPLDTPGYKALTKDPTPAIAWWFDVGAELELPWDGPPADLAATKALAARSKVQTFEACGAIQQFGRVVDDLPDSEVLARLGAGERTLFIQHPSWSLARYHGAGVSVRNRVVPVETGSPSDLEFRVDPGEFGWLFVPAKWYPGWMCEDHDINFGSSWFPVERANLAFMAVETTYSTLRLSYRPWWLVPALLTSSVSLAAAVVIVVLGRRPR
jgi:hypothetical protein